MQKGIFDSIDFRGLPDDKIEVQSPIDEAAPAEDNDQVIEDIVESGDESENEAAPIDEDVVASEDAPINEDTAEQEEDQNEKINLFEDFEAPEEEPASEQGLISSLAEDLGLEGVSDRDSLIESLKKPRVATDNKDLQAYIDSLVEADKQGKDFRSVAAGSEEAQLRNSIASIDSDVDIYRQVKATNRVEDHSAFLGAYMAQIQGKNPAQVQAALDGMSEEAISAQAQLIADNEINSGKIRKENLELKLGNIESKKSASKAARDAQLSQFKTQASKIIDEFKDDTHEYFTKATKSAAKRVINSPMVNAELPDALVKMFQTNGQLDPQKIVKLLNDSHYSKKKEVMDKNLEKYTFRKIKEAAKRSSNGGKDNKSGSGKGSQQITDIHMNPSDRGQKARRTFTPAKK